MKVIINECYGGFGLSDKAIQMLKTLKQDDAFNFYSLKRSDEVLIKVVEELGVESYGIYSELKVMEIPDGLDYTISEYDGLESLVTHIPVTIDELKNGLTSEKIELLKYSQHLKLK